MAQRSQADEFAERLQAAERSHNVQPLVELFAEDAQLWNLTRHNTPSKHDHHEGPTAFWRQYLSAFQNIASRFTHVTDDGRTAVLEWRSTGTLPMGMHVDYCGVSIFEHKDGRIHHFRTYYDSAAFLPHAAHTTKTFSETVGEPALTTDLTS